MFKALEDIIAKSSSIVFFGGAGVSTESGIPDFRSVDGLYHQKYDYPPETILSHTFWEENPEEFYRFYRDKLIVKDAKPNAAHLRLAKLEQQGKLRAVVTQNIDGLHQAAGSKTVYELHGSTLRNYCTRCGKFYDVDFIANSTGVPRCPKCGGRMMKRTGVSKKTNKQYTYYACEFSTSSDPEKKCDFMTWDVPTKDDCPECGQTMFKKAGKGFKRPYCINPACSRFVPEDQRGYVKKKTTETAEEGAESAEAADAAETAAKKTAARKTTAKKSTTAKKTSTKAASTKKTATKTAAAKKTTKKAAAENGAEKPAKKTAAKKTATTKKAAAKKTTAKSADKKTAEKEEN